MTSHGIAAALTVALAVSAPAWVLAERGSAAAEPHERSEPAQQRASARVGESEGRSPADQNCDTQLLPLRQIRGQKVGPSSCQMTEASITYDGRAYKRLDVGLDGTVDGFAAKVGDYKDYFTNGPDLVFPQTWGPRQVFFGVAKYERAKGASMVIIYPADASAWNRRMFVHVHGRGRSFKEGNLKAWDKNFDPSSPVGDLDRYERVMLSKGYALVHTNRTSSEGLGEITATLEDGTTVNSIAFNDTAKYILDFGELAKSIVTRRLGRPVHVYFYGHSAGARIGHSLNYTPGLNVGRDGKPFFDGLLNDDPAAGTWYPVVMRDGKDVLFATPESKAGFVPQIDVAHQQYNNIWPPQHPSWMSSSYLENKRNNARILKEKGVANYRMYEVRGTSHSGGDGLPDTLQKGPLQNIDVSKLMDRFIDILDAWVDKGVTPPPTHSDYAALASEPAIGMPEIACPLGVYYDYPNSTAGATAFAAFTGSGIEPLDGNDVFVDMNHDGVWDYRETPTQAWRRLGLLQPDETLTREKYVSCVTAAASKLRDEGFFSPKTVAEYAQKAQTTDLQPKQATTVVIHKRKGEGG